MNGWNSTSPGTANTSSPGSGLLTPIQNGATVRRVSYDATPSRLPTSEGQSQTNGNTTSHLPAVSPSSEQTPPWTNAIGHANTTGKSGRVIERLMAENDRLKRELELQQMRADELHRSLQTMRPQMEALKAENDNMSHSSNMEQGLLKRRDRKIEVLKAEVQEERERRESADARARMAETQRDEALEGYRRDVQQAQEEAKHSSVHSEIMERSHKQLAAEYRARAETWRTDLHTLHAGREEDRQKLAKLEIVCEQMRTELERHGKLNRELAEKWEDLSQSTDQWRKDVDGVAQDDHQQARKLSTEMDQVVNEMRWLMGVKKNVKDVEPPPTPRK